MIITIDTTPGLNVYAFFRNSSDDISNGSAFETFVEANWQDYAVEAPEQDNSGHYVVSSPAFLVSNASYVCTFYQRLGATPAVGDIALGSHNFQIEPSSSVVVSADLIDRMRTLANDTDISNEIRQETMKPKPDGSRTKFFINNTPVVAGSVYVTAGSGDINFRKQSGFSVDLTTGIITFLVAPTLNVSPFEADYNFNWFSDTEYASFLTQAAYQVSASDPDDVIDGLQPALFQFALYYYWMARATQFAHRYASTGGMASQNVDEVTKNFAKLAEMAKKAGEEFRQQYYEKLGQRAQPATSVVNYGIDPYTPIR